jgi:hypothetical protein
MGVGAVVNISNFVQMTHFCDNHYRWTNIWIPTVGNILEISQGYMFCLFLLFFLGGVVHQATVHFWKMDIFTLDDTRDTAFRADSPYRTRPLGSLITLLCLISSPNYVLLWVEHWRKVVIYWDWFV